MKTYIDKRTDLALNIISKKLFSEGVSAKNWRCIKALYIIRHCILGKKLANYLVDNQEEIKRRIDILSQKGEHIKPEGRNKVQPNRETQLVK